MYETFILRTVSSMSLMMTGPKSDDPKEVKALYVFREFFKSFDDIILQTTQYKKKFGIDLGEAIQNGLSGPNAIQNLVNSLSTQGLGTLIQAAAEVASMSNDLANFTKYDAAQLTELHKKLSLLVKKFDIIIGERK